MSDTPPSIHDQIVKSISERAPQPWFAADFAREKNVSRESLYDPLIDLRLAGLIEVVTWESGRGQGYALTAQGSRQLEESGTLGRALTVSQQAITPREESETKDLREVRGSSWNQGEIARDVFNNPQVPTAMPILLILNLLIFAVGMILAAQDHELMPWLEGKNTKVLLQIGALSPQSIIHNEWWQVLGCCFVHGGIFHLLANMISLFFVGPIAERMWGKWRFLGIYLISGVGGAVAVLLWDPNTILVGASGSLWGTMLSVVVWFVLNRAYISKEVLERARNGLIPVLLINIAVSFLPGVSAVAHFAGGAVGILIAGLFHIHRFGRPPQHLVALFLALFFPLFSLGILNQAQKNDDRWIRLAAAEEERLNQKAKSDFSKNEGARIQQLANEFRELDKSDGIVEKLLNLNPKARDPKEVEKSRKDIERLRSELVSLSEKLQSNLDNGDEKINKLRQLGNDYVKALAAVVSVYRDRLDATQPATDEQRQELRQLRDKIRQTRQQWESR